MDRYRRFGRVANNSYEAQERQYVDRRRSTTEPQAFFNFLPQLYASRELVHSMQMRGKAGRAGEDRKDCALLDCEARLLG